MNFRTAAILLAAGMSPALLAQPNAAQSTASPPPTATPASKVGVLHVQGNVYVIYGAGANITMQVGQHAIGLIDTGAGALSEEVRAAIRSVSPKPISYIINTSADADHIGGNSKLANGGFNIFASVHSGRREAAKISHIKVMERMSEEKSGVPASEWPGDTYDDPDWKLFLNEEPVILYYAPAAHAEGDTFVFFRRSDVVSTGDIFDMTRYPVIDQKAGGSLAGILKAINQILRDIAVPKENEEGGTYIIPGHGRVCDRNDLANYRDMLTIIRDRVQHLVKKGATLEQVKAAKPTFDYDGGYGVEQGPWTTSMFVEAVYRELGGKTK